MQKITLVVFTTLALHISPSMASETHTVLNANVATQRTTLEKNTQGKGFGPQSPRNINLMLGKNTILFNTAPSAQKMNLCNIHFHESAEHKGGEFTKYAGNGKGQGYGSGYKYSGSLTKKELTAISEETCPSEHSALMPGSTIEVHYVYSTAKVAPGPTLANCLSDAISNPQLRVEAQVYVLVNDKNALDFATLTAYSKVAGKNQALNIPTNTGTPIAYNGSTTGPKYNEEGSPYQVSWRVRPKVAKVNIKTLGDWCKDNIFNEDHAHGVRNLVQNPKLLSTIH